MLGEGRKGRDEEGEREMVRGEWAGDASTRSVAVATSVFAATSSTTTV